MQAAAEIPEDRGSIHTGPGKNSGWQMRLTLLAMCIAQGMILLDVTIVNIALPSIQRELHESSSELEWVISAYALSLAALIPLSGTLGDRFGRKRFFAAGMTVFAAGSVAWRAVGIRAGPHRGTRPSRYGGCRHVGAGPVHLDRNVLREGPGRRDRDLGDLRRSGLRPGPGRRRSAARGVRV